MQRANLYQSGYLTLKSYEPEFNDFRLGLPNQEVRQGFAQCLYQHVAAKWGTSQRNIIEWKAMPL